MHFLSAPAESGAVKTAQRTATDNGNLHFRFMILDLRFMRRKATNQSFHQFMSAHANRKSSIVNHK
jgi:hypothetical protein